MSMTTSRNSGARWTLMNASGQAAVTFTSFLSMELRNESLLVDGPVEEGSFATYNKIETPLEVDVSLGIQGDDAALQKALDALNTLQAGLELISLITPDAEYTDLNLFGFSFRRRREDGLGALWVDLSLKSVKQVRAAYTNVRIASRQKRGKVQAKEKAGLILIKEGASKIYLGR